MVGKYCEQCGISFRSVRADAKYCSAKCRKAAARGDAPAAIEIPEEDTYRLSTISVASLDAVEAKDHTRDDRVPNPFIEPVPGQKFTTKPYDREANLAAFKKMGLDEVSWISSGIPDFDALTMIPRGRVTQIQGPFAVGKTTLCLNMLRGLANTSEKVLYIDTEASLSPERLVDLELDSKNFTLYNKSPYIEDIYDVIIEAVKKPKYNMIILDSLAACSFRTEAANAAADANIGQKARIIGKLMRIIPMDLKDTKTALVIINQEREVIGSYAPVKYTPGGMGVPYAASLMVSLKTTKGARFPKSGPPFKGHEVTAEIIKSKVNEPWRKATFKLFYNAEDMK